MPNIAGEPCWICGLLSLLWYSSWCGHWRFCNEVIFAQLDIISHKLVCVGGVTSRLKRFKSLTLLYQTKTSDYSFSKNSFKIICFLKKKKCLNSHRTKRERQQTWKDIFFTGNLLIPRNGRTKFVKPVVLALTCLTTNVFLLAEII